MNPIIPAFAKALEANNGEMAYEDLEPLTMTPELFRHRAAIGTVWTQAEADGTFYRSVEKREGDTKPRLYVIAGSRPQPELAQPVSE